MISRDATVARALKARQSGFLLNPFRFFAPGGGGGGATTWSATDKTAGWSLSAGDLTASEATGSVETIRATDGAASGKTYWEVVVNVSSSGSIAVGVRESGDSITEDLALGVTASIRGNSQLFTSGGFSADGLSGFAYAGPAVLMFAADHVNGYLYVGLDGSWRSGGDPAAGSGGRLVMPAGTHMPYLRSDNDGTNNSATLIADPADWIYSAPAGYSALP